MSSETTLLNPKHLNRANVQKPKATPPHTIYQEAIHNAHINRLMDQKRKERLHLWDVDSKRREAFARHPA